MAFDSKCFELAEHFLADANADPGVVVSFDPQDLAQHIQDAIEAWLADPEPASRVAA